MATDAFIIPCRLDPNNPIIFECVRRVQEHHPDDKILVVDSNSHDKSYFDKLGVEVLDSCNVNYGTNGHYLGWQHLRGKHPFYYFIFDSLLVNSNMSWFRNGVFVPLRHFNSPPTGMGQDRYGVNLEEWAGPQLQEHCGLEIPQYYRGVFGPMWLASGWAMNRLEATGVFNILPNDKWQACAMERLIGIAAYHAEIWMDGSIQGEMIDFHGKYDETYFEKVSMNRL